MKIIRYFCSVKDYNTILKTLCLSFYAIISIGMKAQNANMSVEEATADSISQQMDSVEISLLTCSPGQKIWSLYGHTAVRYEDKAHNVDLAINYGMFNFKQKNFMLRFVFGRTDYEMGIEPFSMFLLEYAKEGRGVVQQTLNLTREEKLAITQAIALNYQPENRVYRYNYFYDNCTTRARDMLAEHLNGKVEYKIDQSVKPTYRQMIHQWNESHPWMSFGCDLLLGTGADRETDFAQQQFLPDTLRKDFGKAMVVEPGGMKHTLVDTTFTLLKVNEANADTHSNIWDTLTPWKVFLALFIITIAIAAIEYKRKKVFWLYDVVLLTLDGLAGLCLFAMIFSLHPTVKVNLQILILNPLNIVFAYSVGNSIVKGMYSKYWTFMLACAVLAVIGCVFQNYAEGMMLLACTLVVRCLINKIVYLRKSYK